MAGSPISLSSTACWFRGEGQRFYRCQPSCFQGIRETVADCPDSSSGARAGSGRTRPPRRFGSRSIGRSFRQRERGLVVVALLVLVVIVIVIAQYLLKV